jgi:hypothetical protein
MLIGLNMRPAGYPANPKAGYQISCRIPDILPDTEYHARYRISCRIPDIRQDFQLNI